MNKHLFLPALLLFSGSAVAQTAAPKPAAPAAPAAAPAAKPVPPPPPPPEDLGKWRYYRTVKLDTTASGAKVKGDVKSFPVVVALDAKSFDFAQAKDDGSDLRFSKTAKGDELPFSIETWDKAGQTAVAWVKLDVVKGNNKTQSFVMHWGNPAATPRADSKKVFDNKEFTGVYHLDEEGNTQEGGYKDATGNEAHMTGVNLKPGARVPGRLGKGLNLVYEQVQWVKLEAPPRTKKRFDIVTRGTFSIWANARAYKNKGNQETRSLPGYETMWAKGDNSWRLQKFGIRAWHKPPADLLEMCVEQPPNADLCVVGKTDMQTGKWYHVVAVHDYPKAKFYVNGVLEKVDTFDVNWKSDDHPVGLGNQSQFPEKGRQWDGILDEARALNVAKDDHWIKLDYESQREDAKLLIFGKTQERFSS